MRSNILRPFLNTDVEQRTDRLFVGLIWLHLVIAFLLSFWYDTWTQTWWIGLPASAIVTYVAALRPGTLLTRCIVATALMVYSALYIQLTHGLSEVHFDVFCELAFLLAYRDWRPIVVGAFVIILHHLAFTILESNGLPITMYSSDSVGIWTLLGIHTGFVIFEVGVLVSVAVKMRRADELAGLTDSYLHLALTSGLGTWEMDLDSKRFTNISPIWRKQFGFSNKARPRLKDVIRVIHPGDRRRARQQLLAGLETRHGCHIEFRVVAPDKSITWLSVHATPTFDAGNKLQSVIGVTQEITVRKKQESEMADALRDAEERAEHDPLTGLLNHRAFHKRFKDETARAQREGTRLMVMLLDLNNFKFFNEAYSHVTGDEVLLKVAERIKSVCRPYDTVARFGGDEFAILIPGVGDQSPADMEVRMRSQLAGIDYCPVDSKTAIPITLSIGAAIQTALDMNPQEALVRADERLARCKTGGDSESEADTVRALGLGLAANFSMLDALVTAVDNKDRYTRKHSEDVMRYSLMIGRGLGLDEEVLNTIGVAALLHDVGKIGVPDSILRKPGNLTDDEYEAVKRHPEMGAVMVGSVAGLEGTLDAIRHHHERWDGKGYPYGLRGEETPLIARLMAVADSYSAMTTDRPYRRGMEPLVAASILRAGVEIQWDPDCVKAFLAALEKESTAALQA